MRVIAGQYGGRNLQAPKGLSTRPTTDRVRESLFSTLASARGGFDDATVLDAFAGSGALGIEALSRGATFALFCENNRTAFEALSRNTSFLSPQSFSTMRADVFKRSLVAPCAFDLVFLDPPYATKPEQVVQLLDRLEREEMLKADVLVSYEHAASDENPLSRCSSSIEWDLAITKAFGDTVIDIYRRA